MREPTAYIPPSKLNRSTTAGEAAVSNTSSLSSRRVRGGNRKLDLPASVENSTGTRRPAVTEPAQQREGVSFRPTGRDVF